MAARIEVVVGPGKGWKYRFRATEVRIGRGAGHAFKVQDPAWQDGCLRVQHRQAGYLVTNEMPHPVFLDGVLLAAGEQRTWYHGARLQPTASTVLVLYADEGADGLDTAPRGVVAVPPSRAEKTSRRTQYLLVGGMLLVALVNVVVAVGGPSRPAGAGTGYARAREALGRLEADAGQRARAARLLTLLDDARFYEVWGQPGAALSRYLEARDDLVVLRAERPGDDGPDAALAGVEDFISQRVIDLAGRHGLPKREKRR